MTETHNHEISNRDSLIAELNHADADVRKARLATLLGGDDALSAYQSALRANHADVRVAALLQLPGCERVGEQDALTLVMDGLHDPTNEVWGAALWARYQLQLRWALGRDRHSYAIGAVKTDVDVKVGVAAAAAGIAAGLAGEATADAAMSLRDDSTGSADAAHGQHAESIPPAADLGAAHFGNVGDSSAGDRSDGDIGQPQANASAETAKQTPEPFRGGQHRSPRGRISSRGISPAAAAAAGLAGVAGVGAIGAGVASATEGAGGGAAQSAALHAKAGAGVSDNFGTDGASHLDVENFDPAIDQMPEGAAIDPGNIEESAFMDGGGYGDIPSDVNDFGTIDGTADGAGFGAEGIDDAAAAGDVGSAAQEGGAMADAAPGAEGAADAASAGGAADPVVAGGEDIASASAGMEGAKAGGGIGTAGAIAGGAGAVAAAGGVAGGIAAAAKSGGGSAQAADAIPTSASTGATDTTAAATSSVGAQDGVSADSVSGTSQVSDTTSGTGTDGTGAGTDGAGTDGAGTDGAGTDGAGTDGAGTDGAGTDGAGTDGAGTDGAGTDGAGTDGAVGTDGTVGTEMSDVGEIDMDEMSANMDDLSADMDDMADMQDQLKNTLIGAGGLLALKYIVDKTEIDETIVNWVKDTKAYHKVQDTYNDTTEAIKRKIKGSPEKRAEKVSKKYEKFKDDHKLEDELPEEDPEVAVSDDQVADPDQVAGDDAIAGEGQEYLVPLSRNPVNPASIPVPRSYSQLAPSGILYGKSGQRYAAYTAHHDPHYYWPAPGIAVGGYYEFFASGAGDTATEMEYPGQQRRAKPKAAPPVPPPDTTEAPPEGPREATRVESDDEVRKQYVEQEKAKLAEQDAEFEKGEAEKRRELEKQIKIAEDSPLADDKQYEAGDKAKQQLKELERDRHQYERSRRLAEKEIERQAKYVTSFRTDEGEIIAGPTAFADKKLNLVDSSGFGSITNKPAT